MGAANIDPARGQRIEDLMTRQGWSPSHLARTIGADRKLIYGWKQGRPVSSIHMEGLAIALETTRTYIESGEGEMHHPRADPPALILKQLSEDLGLPEVSDE